MTYKQDHLRNLAEKYINNTEQDYEKIKNKDITKEFMKQYKIYFQQGTLVVINFNGHTTDGKSTAAAKLLKIGNKYLNKKTTTKNIFSNQQEYANWVGENNETKNIVIQIDEWSRLAETGANATIEQAYFEELSNIHAQMYIHRIYCSPHQLPDPNILLHLEVAAKDIQNKKTICYVYYNLSRAGSTIPQIIGHIVLDVKDILEEEWYKKYRTQKFKRIELLRKHHIIHERELIYASAIQEIIKHFIGYTQIGKIISQRTIESKAKIYCQQKNIKLTMLGIEYAIVTPTKAVLDLYTDTVKIKNEIIKAEQTTNTKEYFTNKIQLLKEQLRRNIEDIDYYMADLNKKKQLYQEYKQHE